MTRRAVKLSVLAAGLVLLAGLLLVPVLPPSYVMPASIVWYLALAVLLGAAFRILSRWIGRGTTIGLIALGALGPLMLTAVPASPAVATLLPCPRNWGWLPTWLLRSSPMGSVSFEVGGARVKVCYGRPAARGRRMIGGSQVPFGQLWRTGANEPTTLITTVPLEVAGIKVPAGRIALYTIPGPESFELILNASTSQWGRESEYSTAVRAHELGHAILPSERGEPVERLTLRPEPDPGSTPGAIDLVLAWETTRLRIPIRPVSR